MKNYRW